MVHHMIASLSSEDHTPSPADPDLVMHNLDLAVFSGLSSAEVNHGSYTTIVYLQHASNPIMMQQRLTTPAIVSVPGVRVRIAEKVRLRACAVSKASHAQQAQCQYI